MIKMFFSNCDETFSVKKINSWILLVCLVAKTSAQSSDLRFGHLTIEDGLANNAAGTPVYQDHHGFIWFGTADGLNRYDGKKIITYKNDPRDSNTLSANHVLCMFEDANQLLWIGTYDGGLNVFNPATGIFKHYFHHSDDSVSIHSNYVAEILAAANGKMWIGTSSGIDLFDPVTGKFHRLKMLENGEDISDLFINHLLLDKDGKLWIAGNHSPFYYNVPANTFTFFENNPTYPEEIGDNQIYHYVEDLHSNIWICTGIGLMKYDQQADRFSLYQHDVRNKNSLSGNFCSFALCDSSGKIWIATSNGLTIFSPKDNRFTTYSSDPSNSASLRGDNLFTIYQSTDHVMWIGSFSGINYTNPSSGKFTVYQHDPNNVHSLSNNAIRNIIEDHNHNIWIATESGLNELNRSTNTFSSYYNMKGDQYVPQYVTWALHEDHEGNIWIGTWGYGLQKFNPATKSFEKYHPKDSTGTGNDYVISITEDERGKFWLATWGGGVFVFDPLTKKFHRYSNAGDNPSSVRSDAVYTTFKDHEGNIWIGSTNGLQRYRPATDDFEWINLDPENKVRYANNISCILEDAKGIFWIGTIAGLFRCDLKTHEIFRFTTREGLPSANVTGILQDDDENIWVSTGAGLAKLDANVIYGNAASMDSIGRSGSYIFKRYFASDGLPTDGFSSSSYCKDSYGNLFFGTVAGFISFHPRDLLEDKTIPPVVITGIKILNKNLETDTSVTDLKQLTLHYADKTISFEFAALNFVKPEKNTFAYQLVGFDKAWQYSGERNFANYTNLKPGKYIFRVKAANNDGVWNEQGVFVNVNMIPPFWMTNWFYAFCFVVVAGSIVLYFRWRTASLRKQKVILEETVEKRTYELKLAKERAEQSEKFKQQFLANMSHEIRTPMNAILGMTHLAKETTSSEKQKEYLAGIQKSSDTLIHIINDILDLSKIEAGKVELEKIDFSLYEVVDQVYHTLRFKADEKGIQLITSIDETVPDVLVGDPVRLNQVLMNLCGNALKFTERGSVTLVVIPTKDGSISANTLESDSSFVGMTTLRFEVIDTGIGIPKEKLNSIFESFTQAHSSDSRRFGGTGLGLTISRQLIELMGGKLTVESEVGSGSKFSFEMNFEIGSEEKLHERQKATHEVEGNILNGLKILLADDNEYNRIVAVDTLKSRADLEVVEASNGKEAISLLEKNNYDVVLMDVQMPEMDGYETTTQIRNPKSKILNHGVPIIALTASVLRTDLDRCRQAGMNSYVPKPFSASQLITEIARVTGRMTNRNPPATTVTGKPINHLHKPVDSAYVDLSYLRNFCEGDEVRMKKYIRMYLESLPPFLQKLNKTVSEKNVEEIARQVHAMKPKFIMMGMTAAKAASDKIESDITERNFDSLNEHIQYLVGLCDESVAHLAT